jgi:5-dehydro-2-deoxygluconokinase
MADRRLDLVAIGRAAVDLYGEQIGGRLEDMTSFAKYVGGSPCNTVIGGSRLGLNCALITRVGDEHMGRFVRETLAAEGVDVTGIKTDPSRLTGLVILGIQDRDTFPLIFYRESCADMGLEPADVDPALLDRAGALLLSGTHFSRANVDATSRRAMALARERGMKIILDIDYRPVLWGLTGHGRGEDRYIPSGQVSAHLQGILPDLDLLVGTEEEILICGGEPEILPALRRIRALTSAVIVLKRGAAGAVAFDGPIPAEIDQGIVAPGFPVEVFNVLGAGDAFMSGFLSGWLKGEGLKRCIELGNASGALVVARHGCAPAMPSAVEMAQFLKDWRRLPAPRLDPDFEHLHRATTRRRDWPEVLAIAFDHRPQFEEMADRSGRPREDIARFKTLLVEAALSVDTSPGAAGAIIDGRYGAEGLERLNLAGRWLARPIELPFTKPLAFEEGLDPAVTLRGWPAGQVVKCLVSYHPDDAEDLRRVQIHQLCLLAEAAAATAHELLIEVIPPNMAAGDETSVPRALAQLYAAGLKPEWWKLPPPATPSGWTTIGQVIQDNDPQCRGVLMLGLEAPEHMLAQSFKAAAGAAICKGFAVGRSLFAGPAEAWFSGRIDDATAREQVAGNYRRLVELWHRRAA